MNEHHFMHGEENPCVLHRVHLEDIFRQINLKGSLKWYDRATTYLGEPR